MTPATLEPRRHAPPADWSPEVFEKLTDALAAALVAAVWRRGELLHEAEQAPGTRSDLQPTIAGHTRLGEAGGR
jgi:hypothetical protein